MEGQPRAHPQDQAAPARLAHPRAAGEGDGQPPRGARPQPQLEAAVGPGAGGGDLDAAERPARGPRDDADLAAGDPGAVGPGEAAAELRRRAEGNGERGAGTVAMPVPTAPRLRCSAWAGGAQLCEEPRLRRRGLRRWRRRGRGHGHPDLHPRPVAAQRRRRPVAGGVGGRGAEQVGAGRELRQRRPQPRRARAGGEQLGRQLGPGLLLGAPVVDLAAGGTGERVGDGRFELLRSGVVAAGGEGDLGGNVVEAQRHLGRGWPPIRCRPRRAARAAACRRPPPGPGGRPAPSGRGRRRTGHRCRSPRDRSGARRRRRSGWPGPWSGLAQLRSKSSVRRQPSPPARATVPG